MMNDMHHQLHDLYFNTVLNYLATTANKDYANLPRWEQTLDDLKNIMIEFGFRTKEIKTIGDCAFEFFQEHQD